LKRAVRNLLPPSLLKQRKQGFGIPLRRWFREELFDFSKKLLLEQSSRSRRFFRPSYVRWLIDSHQSGKQDFGFQLYALVIFELWCRLTQGARSNSLEVPALKDVVG